MVGTGSSAGLNAGRIPATREKCERRGAEAVGGGARDLSRRDLFVIGEQLQKLIRRPGIDGSITSCSRQCFDHD